MTKTRAALFRIALLAIGVGTVLPSAAQAYWRGGVYFGFPPVVVAPPPPYYYPPPPPVYVAPPSVYAAPPVYSEQPPAAQACYAGPWVCPLDRPSYVGNACWCNANGGRAWGHAN